MSSRCLLTSRRLFSCRPSVDRTFAASLNRKAIVGASYRRAGPGRTNARQITTQQSKKHESPCHSLGGKNTERLWEFLAKMRSGAKLTYAPSLKTIRTWCESTDRDAFTAAQYSDLIRLIGSASIAPIDDLSEIMEIHTAYKSYPCSLRVDSEYASRWTFVTKLADSKESAGYSLDRIDHYWLMRSALESARQLHESIEDGRHSKEEFEKLITHARRHYHLATMSDDNWVAHILYLEYLFMFNGSDYVDEIIAEISSVHKRRDGLHPHLISLLWKTIALYGSETSEESKHMFIQTLVKRLHNIPNEAVMSSNPTADGSSNVKVDFSSIGVRDLFVDILLLESSELPRATQLLDAYPWALLQIKMAFRSFKGVEKELPVDFEAAWKTLQIIASSFRSRADQLGRSQDKFTSDSESRAAELTIICTLAALETSVDSLQSLDNSQKASKDAIGEALLFLWMLWDKEAKNLPQTASIICSVIVSFMRLSIYSGDKQLMTAGQRYLTDAFVYPVVHGNLTCTRSELQAIAAQSSLTSIALGVQNWTALSESLEFAHLFPEGEDVRRWMSLVANDILMRLVTYDPSVAFELYVATKGTGIVLSDQAMLYIGKSFLSTGHVDSAFTCLADLPHGSNAKLPLLRTITRAFVRPGYHINIYAVRQLGQALRDDSDKLQVEDRELLEQLLSLLLFSNYRKEGIELLIFLRNQHSNVLDDDFLSAQFDALCSQRRYRTAAKLLMKLEEFSQDLPPRIDNTIRYLKLFEGDNLSEKNVICNLPLVFRNRALLDMAFGQNGLRNFVNWKIWSLQLMNAVAKNPAKYDEMFFTRLVTFLASIGRLKAAQRVVDMHISKLPTAVGNILLSAILRHQSSNRGRRQVDNLLRMLSHLMEKNGFVPDRITVNIVLKCILRWPSVSDSQTLRALFNHLAVGGYPFPDGGVGRSDILPFDTVVEQENISYPVLLDILEKLPKDMSFFRHVRPLYRMFITTFRNRGDDEAASMISSVLDDLDR